MAKVRTAARVDGNHALIVGQLRAVGASVLDVHQLPNCFDILVGYRGRTHLMEIKDPAQPPGGRKLTPGELAFKDAWQGSEYNVVETFAQALAIITSPPKTPKNYPPTNGAPTYPTYCTSCSVSQLQPNHRLPAG